jgi:Asp/Glu/hydantoin racemase
MSLLIINPNSSKSVTDNLAEILTAPPGVKFEFYTAPPEAPSEIDDEETSKKSTAVVLKDFKANKEKYLESYAGYLVCCYSDHPLVAELRELTHKTTLGIFQASITYGLSQSPSKFGILTSTTSWEPLLDAAVTKFFGGANIPLFVGTVASNVNVLGLNNPENFQKLVKKATLLKERGASIILLGCAGLSGLEAKLETAIPGVVFIDSVKVGAELLNALGRFEADH